VNLTLFWPKNSRINRNGLKKGEKVFSYNRMKNP
jgi:hypothetical protein